MDAMKGKGLDGLAIIIMDAGKMKGEGAGSMLPGEYGKKGKRMGGRAKAQECPECGGKGCEACESEQED